MKKYKTFETERLILTPTTTKDALFILKLLNSPKWIKNIGDRNVKSVEDAKKYIDERMKPQLEKTGFSNYTVIRKSDGVKIGGCGLYDREGIKGFDIGFAFLPEYEKKGYAYESALKIKQLARDKFNLKFISAITTHYNEESQKLLEKLGLKYIQKIKLPQDDEELLLYRTEL
ncbi:GNAT family N-acetyltransferase [Abyssalbus ytuae]|uniref:GNAT family N-acetyltransferase n=1 Tax=Abyssalbus ytuae TaxID=2926907 RepID=A0A9E7CXZ4_9FLAO|nr:GNAT family N-acetyltransferase [Abyssalbus ytuae]UOB16090.1 GNAT family N-acetyltransferase [Abyssalbus ytuae]